MGHKEAHLGNICLMLPSTNIEERNQGNANLQLIPYTVIESLAIIFVLSHVKKNEILKILNVELPYDIVLPFLGL